VAQPALSQTITKLESALGVQLFERHPPGVAPTAAGMAFFEKAQAVLLTAAEAHNSLNPWQHDSRLTLGAAQAILSIARPALRRFILAHPEVTVSTRDLSPGGRLIGPKRGAIDAELLYPPPADPRLVERVVATSPRYLLVDEAHDLARECSLVFAQIERETLPGRHPSVSESWAAEAWLMKYRTAAPRLAEETPTSLDELWTMVCQGKLTAILPEFMVPGAEGNGVRAVPLVDVDPVEVCLARRREDRRAALLELFASFDVSSEVG
jgi:DNA-binding transcriptional LysR family regulator